MVQENATPAQLRRQKERDAKREKILEAAFFLIKHDGVDALTMPRLASRLECAVGALYLTFPSKSALLVALQEQAIGWLSLEIAVAVEASKKAAAGRCGESPARLALANLAAAVNTVVELPRRSPARHRLVDELLSSSETVLSQDELATVNATLAGLLGQVTTLLREAQAAGALAPGDVEVRARLLWAALHGLDHFRKRDRGEPAELRTPRLATAMMDTLLRGWGASEDVSLGPKSAVGE